MKRLLAALAIALASSPGWAQWIDQSGKRLPDTASRKSVDGLGAMLLLAGNYNAFIKEWTGWDDKQAPALKPVSKVKRGDDATVLIFFSGCAKAGERCLLEADFKVTGPDGSTYGEFKDRPAFDATIDRAGTVMLSHAIIQMRIEPKDALGEYKVVATLRRPSTKTSIQLEQRLSVIK
jgi:hypothetical protein